MKLGDVVFQDLPAISLIELIDKVQGGPPNHCGIVSGFFLGVPMITEAFPLVGVWTIPYPIFLLRSPFSNQVRRWKDQSLVPKILAFVKTQFGLPYNIHFDDNPKATYCSELIAKGYLAASGKELSCTQTIQDIENKELWASQLFYSYLGVYPEMNSKIWLVTGLLKTFELTVCPHE